MAVATYLYNIGLTAVSSIPSISPWNSSIGGATRRLPNGLLPAREVLRIWYMIYFLNAAMCLYLVILLFRRHEGKPLIMAVKFIPDSFLYSYIIYQISGPAWIDVYVRGELVGTFLLLVLGVVCMLVCLITSAKALHYNGAEMEEGGLRGDIWTVRILVQNAIACYGGWLLCAALINNNAMLVNVSGFTVATASWISLGILNAALVIWFLLESFVFDKQLRYTFTQYIPFILATSGNYVLRYDPAEPYTVYIFSLMIGSCSLAFIKILIMIIRSIKDPISYESTYADDKKHLELSNINIAA